MALYKILVHSRAEFHLGFSFGGGGGGEDYSPKVYLSENNKVVLINLLTCILGGGVWGHAPPGKIFNLSTVSGGF
jgi:hypothetical protein